jgi:hypothetical protein
VTSRRKTDANRANARASTGPRTAFGRARSSKNALRHGLTATAISEPITAEVEALARTIAGAGANADITELARDVARAQLDLERARYARHLIFSQLLNPPIEEGENELAPAGAAEVARTFASRFMQQGRNLRALDRYEQAALARRRRALCALDNAAPQ